MDFTERLSSENSKVYYGRSLQNGVDERCYYICKSRCGVQYLEVC